MSSWVSNFPAGRSPYVENPWGERKSRRKMTPVSMAALTTILGMIPLLGDAFFIAMAVTIMFGLGFATVLTLVVVPVLYATLFGFHRKH